MAIPPGYATAVWPAAGLALVCVLFWGSRVAPGVAIGSFCVNVGTSFDATTTEAIARSIAIAACLALGAALQATVGATLIRRRLGFPNPLEDTRHILRFVLFGGPVACVVGCTVGVSTLVVGGVVEASSLAFNWWTWWAGDTIGVLIFAPLALLVVHRREDVWRRRRMVVGLPLVIGFFAVTGFFVRASTWERGRIRNDFAIRATPVGTVLESQLSKYEEVVASVASYFEASENVTRREFARFCKRALSSHPGLLAISWNPRVIHRERARYEEDARTEGLSTFAFSERAPDGSLRLAAMRPEYFPIYYVEPLERNESALGFDIASDLPRRDALRRARQNRKLAATSRIDLVQINANERSSAGVFLAAPVFDRARDDDAIRGYAIGVFRIVDLVESALRVVDHQGMAVTLVDTNEGGGTLYASDQAANTGAFGSSTFAITFGDRQWRLEIAPTAAYVAGKHSWQAWAVLAGGLLFVGLLGVVLLMTTGHAEQVRASEAKYRALYEDSPDMYLSVELPGTTIVDCNQTLCDRIGYSKQELLGKPFHIVYHPDYLERAEERAADFQTSHEFVDVERTLRTKEGRTIDVSLNLRAVHAVNGSIVGARAVWRDIGGRKQIERDRQFLLQLGDILRSSADIELILAAVSAALGRYIAAPRCSFVEIDAPNDRVIIHRDHHDGVPSVAGVFALSAFSPDTAAEASRGTTLVIDDTATDPRTAARYESAYKAIGTRATIAVPLLRDGVWVVVLAISSDQVRKWEEREITLVRLVAERVWSWVEHLRVLAQLREHAVAAAVSQSEERFRTLVRGVKDYAIFMVDPNGYVMSWNAGAAKLVGYLDEEILGQNVEVFHTAEDRALGHPRELLAKAREAGQYTDEGWRVRKDGARFWADVAITPVFDRDGQLEGYAKVVRDFTERRRQDEALRQNVREREVLLQEVHHRVKNNLQVISSLINMQVRRLDPGETRDAIEETKTRVLAIALIHEKLYQSKDYSQVRFAEYTKSLAHNVFHATGMSTRDVVLELAIDDVPLPIDRAIPCGLVINELMTNALKHAFKDRAGKVRVELKRLDGGKLRLTVADNGVGLPEGFDIRRSPSMGLQLVCTLARQLEAELSVDGKGGATFQLTFSGVIDVV